MKKKRTILVTGGCGFIGSHLVNKLVDNGEEVVVIDNLSKGKASRLKNQISLIIGDFSNVRLLQQVFNEYQPDTLFHLAAHLDVAESVAYPEKYSQNNVTNSTILWEEAAKSGINKIIFSSSCAVYGSHDKPVKEVDKLRPTSPYGESKVKGEQVLSQLSQKYDISAGVFRLFNVGGAINQLPNACYDVIEGKMDKVIINGGDYDTKDGTCLRDYIHVEDVVNAMIRGRETLESNKSFLCNLGSGKPLSVLEIINKVEKLIGKKIPFEIKSRRPGDAVAIVADISHARDVIGWTPTKNIAEVLSYGYEWYKKDQAII